MNKAKMNKSGKVFTLGLMIFYLILGSTALFLLSSNLSEHLPPHILGSYQSALMDSYNRADQKLVYLESASRSAFQESVNQLYNDPETFFTRVEGDLFEDLGCGNYGYTLWNDKKKACLVGDGPEVVKQKVLDALTPKTLEFLTKQTLSYPQGGFTIDYTLTPIINKDSLSVRFSGPKLTEPIIVGIAPDASEPAVAASQISDQLSQTTQARVSGFPIEGKITVTSCFGSRGPNHPHRGMDLRNSGKFIAAADGTVVKIGYSYDNAEGGKYVLMKNNGFYTRYMHLDANSITVKPGDFVKAGQVLGTADLHMSVKGKKLAPHLHFEVWVPQRPKGGIYFTQNGLVGYAINPACLYTPAAISKANLKDASDTACLSQGADAPRGWCDQYGIDLSPISKQLVAKDTPPTTATPATTPISKPSETTTATTTPSSSTSSTSSPPATGKTSSPTEQQTTTNAGAPSDAKSGQPSTEGLSSSHQTKILTTVRNRDKYGWGKYVVQYATSDVPPEIILGIITQESLGDPNAISSTGCVGLMQICHKTGEGTPTLKGAMTICGAKNCRDTHSCNCNPGNDLRFDPSANIQAGIYTYQQKERLFRTYSDRFRLTFAAYNIGEGVVNAAVRGTGSSDPSWDEVATYLKSHPDLVRLIDYYKDKSDADCKDKVKQVINYVDSVMMYVTAWRKGTPLDATYAQNIEQLHNSYGEFTYVGTYSFSPDVVVKLPNRLTPFLSLVGRADSLLTKCATADVPGECLISEAKKENPVFNQTCEEPGVQYFLDLYQAIRDCSENGQYGCSCSLPTPPTPPKTKNVNFEHNYTFSINPTARTATLLADKTLVEGLTFSNLSINALRVRDPDNDLVVPLGINITLSQDGKLSLVYQENNGPRVTIPSFFLSKDDNLMNRTVILPSVLSAKECAPVKTHYLFCAEPAKGLSQVKFGLTLKDDKKPAPPTALVEETTSKQVKFTPSTSKDVAFYNVYDHKPTQLTSQPQTKQTKPQTQSTQSSTQLSQLPTQSTKVPPAPTQPTQTPTPTAKQSQTQNSGPIIQLKTTATNFNVAKYVGKTLFITAVDRSGNEGDATTITIT